MRPLFLLFSAWLLISCSAKEPLYNTQSYVFGTLVDISIYGEDEAKAQAVSNAIIQQYNTLHHRLHAWKPSDISAINQAFAAGQSITVKPDITQILTEAKALSLQSKGAFNPAIGQLIKLWGFQDDTFTPHHVDAKAISMLVDKKPAMTDIVIKGNQIHSENPAVQLDLGGYAKGYALDIGLNYLKQQNIKNALINIGGNIVALGKHGEQAWRVGIQHPRQPNAIATIALEGGWTIGTSGDYQRYFELDGKRYCHIIDPNTGYPKQGMQSVTILIPPQTNAGVLSDVASKPIFIAKSSERIMQAKAMGINNFLIITDDHHIQASANMQQKLTWLDSQAEKNVQVINLE